MSTLDHLVWATPSVDSTARMLGQAHGLAALQGGMHPAWGTRNAVIPLGGSYLELVEVADAEAPDVGFTRRIRQVAALGGGLALWCERVDHIDARAAALGYDVVPGRRENPDGSVLSWRVAGMPQACAAPSVPFLIEWDDPAAMPGRLPVQHRCGTVEGVEVRIAADGPRSVVIRSTSGAVTLP